MASVPQPGHGPLQHHAVGFGQLSLRPASLQVRAQRRGVDGALQQSRPFFQHQLHVDPGLDLHRRVVQPSQVRVGPSLNRKGVSSRLFPGGQPAFELRQPGADLEHPRAVHHFPLLRVQRIRHVFGVVAPIRIEVVSLCAAVSFQFRPQQHRVGPESPVPVDKDAGLDRKVFPHRRFDRPPALFDGGPHLGYGDARSLYRGGEAVWCGGFLGGGCGFGRGLGWCCGRGRGVWVFPGRGLRFGLGRGLRFGLGRGLRRGGGDSFLFRRRCYRGFLRGFLYRGFLRGFPYRWLFRGFPYRWLFRSGAHGWFLCCRRHRGFL